MRALWSVAISATRASLPSTCPTKIRGGAGAGLDDDPHPAATAAKTTHLEKSVVRKAISTGSTVAKTVPLAYARRGAHPSRGPRCFSLPNRSPGRVGRDGNRLRSARHHDERARGVEDVARRRGPRSA